MKKVKSLWQAKVDSIHYGALDIVTLNLLVPKTFQAKPGQFVLLPPLSEDSVLPRPFSIVGISPSDKIRTNLLTLWIKRVGKNTALYSRLPYNKKIDLIGPKGLPIKIASEKKYILVGGGAGYAALAFLADELSRQGKKIIVIAGAKKKAAIPALNPSRGAGTVKLIMASESGKYGKLATDLLIPLLKKDGGEARVVACGPKAMLKKVAEISADYGNGCEVILEEIMACGTGSCKGCAVFGKDGTVRHVCSDGPAFDAKWIDWPKLLHRSSRQANRPTIKKPAMDVCLVGQNLKTLLLASPLLNGSGCLGIEALEKGEIDLRYVGALETKGVTVKPRAGNDMPRICEVESGVINSIGLQNVGLEKFLSDELPRWLKFGKPVIINISGFSLEEYAELAEALGKTAIAGLEVNISCPNIKGGGMSFGTNPDLARQVTSVVRKTASDKFIIVKLTPNVTDIVSIAKAVKQSGADAISLVNTFQAMDIDVATRRPKIGAVAGGLSGPAIATQALWKVRQLHQAKLGIPIIGMGGIDSAETAAKFFMAGANAIAVGTGSFGRPHIFTEIFRGLEKIIKRQGLGSVTELTGSLITD